jgi:GT2 family glycosyltransferase
MSSATGSLPVRAESTSARHDEQPARVDCAIVIVTYNSSSHIDRLLDSLPAAAEGLSIRCIVVDNDSPDNTVEKLRAREDITLVETGANLGYAGAINIGRLHAGPCSSILVLNPDLEVEPGTISRLYAALDSPDVGIAVPTLLDGDGHLYPSLRREPTAIRSLGEALLGNHLPKRPGFLSEIHRDHRTYEDPRDVAWAGGAALLISAACNDDVGAWDDQRFFLYSEETDFARRARSLGYRIRYVPSARAIHENGGSGRAPALSALMTVNRIRYFEKYHQRPATSLFRIAVALHCLLRCTDADQRSALKAVCRRSGWSKLPGGRA